eukprot:5741910-Amphidinium_carterae.1
MDDITFAHSHVAQKNGTSLMLCQSFLRPGTQPSNRIRTPRCTALCNVSTPSKKRTPSSRRVYVRAVVEGIGQLLVQDGSTRSSELLSPPNVSTPGSQ